MWCSEHSIPPKQLSITDFAVVAKDSLFWCSIVTSPQLICDVTRKLDTSIVTSYSSIVLARANWRKGDIHYVNNSREYRYLVTWYSRPRV